MASPTSNRVKHTELTTVWMKRTVDYRRHVHDLRTRSYEGATSREEREKVFHVAFDLLTPVAEKVLSDLNVFFLAGLGWTRAVKPSPSEDGGLIGFWELTWPVQQRSKNRFTQLPLAPSPFTRFSPSSPLCRWSGRIHTLRCCAPVATAAWPRHGLCRSPRLRMHGGRNPFSAYSPKLSCMSEPF